MEYTLPDGSLVEIGWDIDDWDWDDSDSSWLSSKTQLSNGGFFIHGGRIRHQRKIPWGNYSVETFIGLVRRLAEGIQDVKVEICEDTGGGDPGFWVEGVREPILEDVERIEETRKRRDKDDEWTYKQILRRHPDWGGD